jgi:hypothetical protein
MIQAMEPRWRRRPLNITPAFEFGQRNIRDEPFSSAIETGDLR